MRSSQGKGRLRVIERRRAPAARGVADGAVGGESGSHVIGIRGSSEIRFVARVTIYRRVGVVSVGVALRAS